MIYGTLAYSSEFKMRPRLPDQKYFKQYTSVTSVDVILQLCYHYLSFTVHWPDILVNHMFVVLWTTLKFS